MTQILNVSAYRFVPLADLPALRQQLLAEAGAAGLRGTILLAEEGINLFLAGAEAPLRAFLAALQADARFAVLPVRESWSDAVPFRKLLVKIKREIIRMDRPAVQPAQGRAPALPPATLRRWLAQGHDDGGRPLVLLDTRNAFEVDYGTFEGAIDWRLAKFSEFPRALEEHRAELEGKAVVSFCTGGIRCEKAALVLRDAGLDAVWQLEGGILGWFAAEGSRHYRGGCFVFDAREALQGDLQPAPALRTSLPAD